MSDHEHRAYEVWDGDSHWAPAKLESTVEMLEYRIRELEEAVAGLERAGEREEQGA